MANSQTLLLVRCTLLAFGVLALGVSVFADKWMSSLGENLAFGYGTVERLYAIQKSGSSSLKEYRADVRLDQLNGKSLRVDLLKEHYQRLGEGDAVAVAWNQLKPGNNIASEHVDQLVRGEISPEQFIAGQKQFVRWGYLGGGGFLLIGCLSFALRATSIGRRGEYSD